MRAEALGTIWGLFRHHWVVFKFLMTVFAMVVLLIYMRVMRHGIGNMHGDVGFLRIAIYRFH